MFSFSRFFMTPQKSAHDLGGRKGLSLDGTPMRRGSFWAFCKQKVFRSAAAWETFILRIPASNRSCLTVFCRLITPLALLFDMSPDRSRKVCNNVKTRLTLATTWLNCASIFETDAASFYAATAHEDRLSYNKLAIKK